MDQPTPTFCSRKLEKKEKSTKFSTFIQNTLDNYANYINSHTNKLLILWNLKGNNDDKKSARKRSQKDKTRIKSHKKYSKSVGFIKIKLKKQKKYKSDKNSRENINNFRGIIDLN